MFLILPSVSAKNKDKYKKWIQEEVNLIITKAEKAEFQKMKKEKDKDLFIELFWAKRDPTPLTEKNEFKEEYYERLSHVNKSYIYGYKKGTQTDMGKVYLYFGEPKILHPATSAARDSQAYPLEIWAYRTQPWMDIPQESFSFVFSYDDIGYVLDRFQTDNRVMQTFYAYPDKILLWPNLKEIPEYKKIIVFNPESFEGKLIQQLKSTQEDIVQIPFEKKIIFTKAENKSCYVTFLLKIDPGEEKGAAQKNLVFFGRMESDTDSYNFKQEKSLSREKNYLISQIGMPLFPGEYNLFLGVSTPDNKSYSLKMEQISVPDLWNQELSLSSILASHQVQDEKAPGKEEEYDAFFFGRYSLLPFFSQEYSKDQSLNLFYYVYNIAVDENQNCSLLIKMELEKGEKKFNLNPQNRKQKIGPEGALLEGTQIPLSVLPEQGEYVLTVNVTDEITQKTASRKLKFSIR
jgi:GWxTD domain-containing protein